MLERNELARALTELPDDLLLEGEQTRSPKKIIRFHRLIAAAAVIALLAVTVGAASAGLVWNVGTETAEDLVRKYGDLAWDYYRDHDESMGFEKLEYSMPLEVTELPEQNMEKLRDGLRRYWNLSRQPYYAYHHGGTSEREFVCDSMEVDCFLESHTGLNSITPGFASLTEAEQLLGTVLDVPDELREAIEWEVTEGCTPLSVRIHTGVTKAQAAEVKGELEPTKVVVSFDLQNRATNGRVVGSITIPLTEETAQEGLQGLRYSYEKEGPIWQEEQTVAGRKVMLFGNNPEEGYNGWCEAVYVQDGIGYCISAHWDAKIPYYIPDWPHYDSARDLVVALLDEAE